jgi:hypothetical protein
MISHNDRLLLEQLCNTYGNDVIQEELMKSKLTRTLGTLSLAGALAFGGAAFNNAGHAPAAEEPAPVVRQLSIEEIIPDYYEKVAAVEDYLITAFTKYGHPERLQKLDVTAEDFVKVSYEENIDLPLLLAAGWVETKFGTEGVCVTRGTNSMFSVGAWDDGTTRNYYDSKVESMYHYAQIIKNDYLRGRGVDELLKDGNFVNKNGHRYASNPKYERDLRNTRNKILRNYEVLRPDFGEVSS